MADKLVKFLMGLFGGTVTTLTSKYIFVFILSLFPILELRGGLIAASLLKLPPIPSLIICLVANIIVILPILLLLEKVFDWMSKVKTFKKVVDWCKKKAHSKKDLIEKYGYLGLMLFVAIPLPGSGAWTGCLIAVLLGMDKKKSFVAALLGVLIASAIMMLFSYGLLKGILN